MAFVDLNVVGGHEGILTDGAQVCKPMHTKRGDAELKFYQNSSNSLSGSEFGRSLLSFLPKFYGTQAINNKQYILLEDLTNGYKNPSIMDVKIGVQAWDDDATHDKVLKEAKKYPKQVILGTRFTGMRVWDPINCSYKQYSREFGYSLTEASFYQIFDLFLHDGTSFQLNLAFSFKKKVQELKRVFERQNMFRFYGSSLLFLYEISDRGVQFDLKMIDFAHVWPIQDSASQYARDGSYLVGLETIENALDKAIELHR